MDVGVLEGRNRFSELIEAAERGETVTITRRGKPVARIVGLEETPESRRARALAALEEARRNRDAIFARTGLLFTWEENKKDRDEGRP